MTRFRRHAFVACILLVTTGVAALFCGAQSEIRTQKAAVEWFSKPDDFRAMSSASAERCIGAMKPVGVLSSPRRVKQLVIDSPGVYENILIDGEWSNGRLCRIKANGVVLRNCEIRNGRQNAIEIYAENVVIENCHIHHVLRGSFKRQSDAHGITGAPRHLVVRNCEIHHVSGDALQFDPDRNRWGDVLIENCEMWTGPLEDDSADFRKGERPGENGIDTKCNPENPGSHLLIRNCLFHGWHSGQIRNQAAINLKERVVATIENCMFRDNDICLRLRGDTGRGNADVTIRNCAVYRSKIGVRTEDRLDNLQLESLGFDNNIGQQIKIDRDVLGTNSTIDRLFTAPEFESALRDGIEASNRSDRGVDAK